MINEIKNILFKYFAYKTYTRRHKTLNLRVRIDITSDLNARNSPCAIQKDGKEDRPKNEDIRLSKKRG